MPDVFSPSEQPLGKPLKPYAWPSKTGVLTMRVLRDYARWLFPKLKREWASPGVMDLASKPETHGKRAPEYRFPKSSGACLMKQLIHFANYVIPALKQSIQQTQVSVLEDFNPLFREVQYGQQQPGREEEVRWQHTQGLAFMADALILDTFVFELLQEKEKKGAGVTKVDI